MGNFEAVSAGNDQIEDSLIEWLRTEAPLLRGPQPTIARKCYRSIDKLIAVGILKPSHRAWWISGYFEVPKGNRAARAIFSGKGLTNANPTPPGFNLNSGGSLVRLILSFLFEHRRIWGIIGDFRPHSTS